MTTQPDAPPTVTVLIAAYNEAPVIGNVVRTALQALAGGEVLVVDDGSNDGTDAAAAAAGARVLRLACNGGKGAAVRRGLTEVRGERVVLIDGDGQDDAAEIPRLLEALRPGVDLVVGSRFIGVFEPGAITPVNHCGNRFLTGLVNLLFSTSLTDTQAGFKALRTDVLRRMNLRADRFDIEVDLLLGVLRAGGRVVEVPVSRRSRQFGKSRLNSLRDGLRILRRILALRMGGSNGRVRLGASQE
jgi:glycosyltransferase involved in cell wall biosynthesis